jgi:acyl-CoA reductase-like NAD-dependent aldehyde dehydrogenase
VASLRNGRPAIPRKLKSLRDLADPARKMTHTIAGKGERSTSSFEVINPSTAAPFANCPDASAEQLDDAIKAARRAFAEWSRLSFTDRRKYLHKFAARVRDYADDLAAVITREQGKPLSNSVREVAGTANSLEAMSNIKIKDQVLRNDGKNRITPLALSGHADSFP